MAVPCMHMQHGIDRRRPPPLTHRHVQHGGQPLLPTRTSGVVSLLPTRRMVVHACVCADSACPHTAARTHAYTCVRLPCAALQVRGRTYKRHITPQMEKEYANPDHGDEST